ncbi:MAG: HAMP domain-containing histidine kinase [Bacteroidaceae bacterium]|nr:HAMP domain-containing histidine kinase [Bacteroidaceae bacterium]
MKSEEFAAAIIVIFLVVAAIATVVYWYWHQCLLKERAEIMRDAIKHRDFSFRLPTHGLFFGEKALQEALNDMGQEIQKLVAHSEVESWQKLTRVLTHEIMNAITPIQSISQAYLSYPETKDSPYGEGIRAINDTSTGLLAFVESYRKLTQLQEPEMTEVNMLSFARSLASLYPNLHWDIDIPADMVLQADENMLRQVFINLVKNAIEAEAKKIGMSSQPAHSLLFFSNDGHIIPLDMQQEIFIPFFTTKRNGSGIGLSLSRQILMKQGMMLSLAESPVRGYNVTFRIEKN